MKELLRQPHKKTFVFVILLSLISITLNAQSWTNPFTLSGQWSAYGVGDPFVMRYKGVYYLYVSTKDNNVGVKCFSSRDLINWTDAVMCSTDEITKGAYAPEVVYWNGKFYMYTSPAGNGHYVLSGDSPTGPFTVITSNVGRSIDGSVFINDDGNWYFYHASGSGILGCTMSSPTTFGSDVNVGACMGNNWTEGPGVIKRNGVYYLLYTGNHVLSKGYRIDLAKSTVGPISSYTAQSAQNPILIKSEGTFVGLGHGAPFLGPDLDTYFYSYHNLVSTSGPQRQFNYDRIAWNGDKLLILGPTNWSQQAAQQPDFKDYFERTEIGTDWTFPNNGTWALENNEMMTQRQVGTGTDTVFKAILNKTPGINYTAEFYLKEIERTNNASGFGVIFGYTDEDNYSMAIIHSYAKNVEINTKTAGVWGTTRKYVLPTSFDYSFWHSMRIEKYLTTYKIFVDGMLKSTFTGSNDAGKIGYITSSDKAGFGFTAFSNKVNGTGIFDTYKPVPGAIQAVHYNNGGEGMAYHDLSVGNSAGKYIRNDSVDIDVSSEGGYAITNTEAGEWCKYNINVKTAATYNVGLRYASAVSTGQIRIWQGDTDLTGIIDLPSTGNSTTWNTQTIKGLNLTRGQQEIRVEIINGGFSFYELNFVDAKNEETTITDTFDSAFIIGWYYSDGSWSIESGEASINGYGKKAIGNTGWTDYTVQTDVTYFGVMNAGLIFRVNNPAIGGNGTDPILGTDFYQGYFVTLSAGSVVLGKQNYSWTQLATKAGTYTTNVKYTIRVVVKGANIKVYVDDMLTPKIDYTDAKPFICGKVGLRAFNAYVHFDNFSVTTSGNSTAIENPEMMNGVEVFPNPGIDQITVRNTLNYDKVSILNSEGKILLSQQINENECQISTSLLPKGLYFLNFSNQKQNETLKFIKN